jgi:hypothetical protein
VGIALQVIGQVVVVAVVVSVLGDLVHALLHLALKAPAPLCWPGLLHQAHHRFLDEQLAFHDERFWRNVLLHQLPELGMRAALTLVVGVVIGVDPVVVGGVAGLFGVECGLTLARRGRDRFHRTARPVPPPATGLLVDAGYHAHHHAFPGYFLGAHVQFVDRLFGRLLPLAHRDVVVVGGSRFCASLTEALEGRGARVCRLADDDADVIARAADADILVLGHGAFRRDATSYEAIIAGVLQARQAHALPLEVWAVGDDDVWAARRAAFADRVVLRVLRRAPMLGASSTLFWLTRGARSL